MSLLSNLIEFGNIQSTTLEFCQSPKTTQIPYCPPIMSAQKQSVSEADRSRPASKSLTKMSFFTSVQKIDPKERIIHRLVYKLQMKCRKHYYNFFVRLQNFKKKPVSMKNSKLMAILPNVLQKLNQTSQLLYSKYFSRTLLKESFPKIRRIAQIKEGLRKINKLTIRRKIYQCFSKIVLFSKQIEKNHIRIDILVSSLKNIETAMQKRGNKNQLKALVFNKIFDYSSLSAKLSSAKLTANSAYTHNDVDSVEVRCFSWIGQADIVPHPAYQALKSAQKIASNSAIRPSEKIKLSIGKKYSNAFQKANYLKTHFISADKLVEEPIKNIFQPQFTNALIKKCEPDYLNSQQVNDIYDNNTLFFEIDLIDTYNNFGSKQRQMSIFSHSIVEAIKMEHTQSQASLISPLCDNVQGNSLNNISVSSARYNSFGLQAVSFKNSLISERQSMKDHLLGERKVQNTPEGLFVKHNITKQFLSTTGYQTVRRVQKNELQNEKYCQIAVKDADFSNKQMLKSSARVPIIETQNRLSHIRKSVGDAKLTPMRDDSRKAPQTFLKITKKN